MSIDPFDLAAMRDRQKFGDGVGDSLGKWAAVCNKDRGDLLALVEHLRDLATPIPGNLRLTRGEWEQTILRLTGGES